MKLKIILTLQGLLLCGMVTASLANPIISLTPTDTTLTGPGQYATLDLVGDFRSDPTKGGSFELVYIPILDFVDFTWNWTADDPQSRVVVNTPGVDDANPSVLMISFSNLDGISVNDTIGTLTFVTLTDWGSTIFWLKQDSLYSSISPYPQQTLTYHTAVVRVTPLPGSVWLLGSALLGFVVVRRRRKIIALLRQ